MALAKAIVRVFLGELPGRALTWDAEDGAFRSTAPEMGIDYVIGQQIELLPLNPGTPLGMEFRLDVRNDSDEVRTVRAGDLAVVGRRAGAPVFNPETNLAFLRPGEEIHIDGLKVTQGLSGEHARFSHVPSAGSEPVGVPEYTPEFIAAGAQTRPTLEEATACLEALAAEAYLPPELAAALKAKAAAGAAAELVSDVRVSLADVMKFRVPALEAATAWRVTGWATAVPEGTGTCRELIQRAVRCLAERLGHFGRAIREKKLAVTAATKSAGGRIELHALGEGFSKTVGGMVSTFAARQADTTVTCTSREAITLGALEFIVDTPGGEAEAFAALGSACAAALAATEDLQSQLKRAVERPARVPTTTRACCL